MSFNMKNPFASVTETRQLMTLIFALSLLATLFSFILQNQFHLEPCSLCIIQRFSVMACGVLSFIALWTPLKKKSQRLTFSCLIFLVTLPGVAAAIHQLYLYNKPKGLFATPCAPGLDYFFDNKSWGHALSKIFHNNADCSQVQTLWSIQLPFLSLLVLLLLLTFSVTLLFKQDL